MPKRKMNRRRARIDVQLPEVTHAELEILHTDPAFQTPEPKIKTPKIKTETREENKREKKKTVTWIGRAIPTRCPYCGATVLQDRLTKACVVIHTRKLVEIDDIIVRYREMKCIRCERMFTAREKI